MTAELPISEADLQAYADGRLASGRRAEVETWLANRPEEAERIAQYRGQAEMLHALYDPVLDEPVPERLQQFARRRPGLRGYARVAGWIAIGAALGVMAGWQLRAWQVHETLARSRGPSIAWSAAVAHVTFSPEVRHPVEVGADQEAHLVAWLSKRLGAHLRVPALDAVGLTLVGGRLLPGDAGRPSDVPPAPVAQFMYQGARGQRVTLYVRTEAANRGETAFRFAREGSVRVFYWIDHGFGYALSTADMDRTELLRVANSVYKQLNP